MSNEHIVMFSGGAASYAAAKRVLDSYPEAILLFADTRMEDADLYRFLDDVQRRLNREIIRVSDGRTPWELFHEEGMIGNTRADLCSRILKRELLDNWIAANATTPTVYFGFDFTEGHRLDGVRRAKPYRCEAPLIHPPFLFKPQIFDILAADGIELPRLYQLGFQHNNCGGFCIKAGHGAFTRLLRELPDRYAFHEEQERLFRERTGKDVAILRNRIGGETKPLTLEALRLRLEGGTAAPSEEEGGCNCFVPPVETEAA